MQPTVVTQPGYVRLALDSHERLRVRAACRRFAAFCREESASRGLIVAGTAPEWDEALAASGAGFRLAVVARGPSSTDVAREASSAGSRRSVIVKVFRSEHQAAAWLMR